LIRDGATKLTVENPINCCFGSDNDLGSFTMYLQATTTNKESEHPWNLVVAQMSPHRK